MHDSRSASTTAPTDRERQLLAALDRLPRYALVPAPTPLEHLQRLSDQLGINLHIKRDDVTGIGGGGNKLRKLEHIVGNALKDGIDTLITTGGPQSNHARLTAAVAARAGMQAQLVLKGRKPARWTGNLLLARLFGAHVTFANRQSWREIDGDMEMLCERLAAEGREPRIIPLGGATADGTAGYMRAFSEYMEQCKQQSLVPDVLVLAAGTGSTCAGLLLGAHVLGADCELLAMSVSRPRAVMTADISRCVADVGDLFGFDLGGANDRLRVEDAYVGPGYASPSREGQRALRLVARTEGILLDSTYTAKAFAGLLDLARKGAIKRGSTVVFWHTGGAPELYSHPLRELAG